MLSLGFAEAFLFDLKKYISRIVFLISTISIFEMYSLVKIPDESGWMAIGIVDVFDSPLLLKNG